jgi:branched-chain amino acid transport system permease protein
MMLISQLINGMVLGSVYALLSLGLTMIFGILGIVNFAQGELYMLGAYVGYFLIVVQKVPFLLALLISMLVMGVFGLLIERFPFRPIQGKADESMILATVGLSVFLMNGAILLFGADPRRVETPFSDVFIHLGTFSISMQRILVFTVTVVLIILLTFFIRKTRMGKAMRACQQDLNAARIVGIDTKRVSMVTCFIGSALAAAAGVLIAPLFLVSPVMGLKVIAKAFVIVILGGLGNVAGAIMGGFIIGIAENLTAGFISSDLKDIIPFTILILILLLRPEGIFGKQIPEKV